MKTQSTLSRTVLGVAAIAGALTAVVPAAAQAQQYGSAYDQTGQYYYDGCRRDQNSRAVVGGVLGALTGMAIGNNVSSRPSRRHDSAAAGAVVGAIAGASIGKGTAGCVAEPAPRSAYTYDNRYDDRYDSRYSSGYAYTPDYRYQDEDYDRYAYAPQPSHAPQYAPPQYAPQYDYGRPPLACTYAESPVRMPDGRTQKRMVQVCPDSQGRYQIVE